MKIINLTAVSATFELENESIYYNEDKFDVFLDGKIVIKDEKRRCFTQGFLQSHALLQTYGAILPTSLTYVPSLIDQRFLTLETCCGYWYGRL